MASIPYPAGLFRRLAAATYDLMLLVALLFAAAVVVLIIRSGEAVPAGTLWFNLYLATVAYLFFGWFWTHGGQTLGMRAWRLQLRHGEAEQIDWLRALRRFLVASLAWPSIIGILWCKLDPQQRTWQDILSSTEIVVMPKVAARQDK